MRKGFILPLILFFVSALSIGAFVGAWLMTNTIRHEKQIVFTKLTDVAPPDFSAEAMFAGFIALDGTVQEIISKNSDTPLPVASITKLLAVPITSDLIGHDDIIVRVSESAASLPNSNHLTFEVGQMIRARDLMAVALVESNNDAVSALADDVGQENVLRVMRERANLIGMNGTTWVNVTGLDTIDRDAEVNSASARGLARLGAWTMQERSNLFAHTHKAVIQLVNARGEYLRDATSTNELLFENNLPFALLGGKTGETRRAGQNLLTLWQGPLDTTIVTVVMHSEDRFSDTRNLINYIAKTYSVELK